MFLRNYDNYFVANNLLPYTNSSYPSAGSVTAISPTSGFEDGTYVQRSTNGTNNAVGFSGYSNSSGAYARGPIMFVPHGICLGNGSAEVTYNDYTLSGNVVENKLVLISSNKTYDFQTHKWKMTMVASYSNTGDADITISEWGLWRSNSDTSVKAFSNSSPTCCLMFREVLDEPIVIEAGTTATLNFSIEIPMANHP